MTSHNTKLLERLFTEYNERYNSPADTEQVSVLSKICDIIKEDKTEENAYAHIFICSDNETANKVNVFPENIAKVMDNLLIIPKLDEFKEQKDAIYITVDGKIYNIPMLYSYSVSFIK